MKLASVVLIGRTNVGKSSIFNRLSTDARSITFDVAGVTRDVIKDVVTWQNRTFELVDTGGINLRKTADPISQEVRSRALHMLEQAEILLFVVDASAGLLPEDREIAAIARKHGKKIILVINKADVKEAQDHINEFQSLGFEHTIAISAIHGRAIGDLLSLICAELPEQKNIVQEKPAFKIVLLGKPNVGKSSLMNLLLQEERAIVSPIAGTTREPISEKVTFYKEDIILTDTAGVRRKRSVKEPLETLMVKTSFKALDDADIVLLLIDGSQGTLADQELKLAFYAFEHHKALILLINKHDLIDESAKENYKFDTDVYQFFLEKIPQLTISCKTGKNIGKILPLVQEVWQRYSQEFNGADLNIIIKEALLKKPLYHKTQLLKVYKVEQVGTAPITILLTVNEPAWFGDSQFGFFDHCLRQEFDLKGVPIKFITKKFIPK